MYPHHERAITRLTEHYQNDPTVLALLISGSVARGWNREDSDVDYLVVIRLYRK